MRPSGNAFKAHNECCVKFRGSKADASSRFRYHRGHRAARPLNDFLTGSRPRSSLREGMGCTFDKSGSVARFRRRLWHNGFAWITR